MRNSARKRLKWSLQHVAQAWPADKKHRCRAHKHVRQTGPRVQAVLRVQPESSPQLGHWYLEQIFLTSSPSGKNAIQSKASHDNPFSPQMLTDTERVPRSWWRHQASQDCDAGEKQHRWHVKAAWQPEVRMISGCRRFGIYQLQLPSLSFTFQRC